MGVYYIIYTNSLMYGFCNQYWVFETVLLNAFLAFFLGDSKNKMYFLTFNVF